MFYFDSDQLICVCGNKVFPSIYKNKIENSQNKYPRHSIYYLHRPTITYDSTGYDMRFIPVTLLYNNLLH